MASPILTPMPVQTDTHYRPVSRLAVIGLLAALLSPLIFVNENLFWVLLAVILPAFILCLVAWRSIRNSEGNLAGESLALMGIVVSVASGLGWLTMTSVTKYVTESEAKAAVTEWLEKLQNNEPGAAFLMTNSPRLRALSFNPEDYRRLRLQFPGEQQQTSAFDNFLLEPICAQILRYGDQIKLQYAGLIDTQTTRESPVFRFRFLLRSPIADSSFVVSVRGENYMSDEGIRRGWKMSLDGNATFSKNTAYGEQLRGVQARAQDEVERFIFDIANNAMEEINKKFDQKNQGELHAVIGSIRPKGRTGPITPIGLLKPMRLRQDNLTGNTWTLTFDCTTIVENERSISFSVVFTTSDPAVKTYLIKDCQFLGMRKIQAAAQPGVQSTGGRAPIAPVQ